jgi:pentalenic acid synthase
MNRVTLWDGKQVWLVTGHSHGRRLLADPRFSADRARPDFPAVLPRFETDAVKPLAAIGFDPPDHEIRRGILTAAFSVQNVRKLRAGVERKVADRAERMLRKGPPTDLVRDYALPIPSMVISGLLGVPDEDHDFFERATVGLLQADSAETAEAAGATLLNYLDDMVKAKELEPDDTLLSTLASNVGKSRLDRDIVPKIAMGLLIGGHDTTSSMIAMGVITLLEHRDQLAAMCADPAMIPAAVDELLRMVSVTDVSGVRVATEDVEIHGVLIRAGEGIIVSSSMVNRDPDVYASPYTFDIHRSRWDTSSSRRHLTFGYGVHQCLGQNLARMALEVAFSTLFDKISTLRLAVPLDQLPMRRSGTMQGVHELPVTW